MAKKIVDNQHEKNMLRLWTPTIWTAALGALTLAAGVLLGDFVSGYETYSYILGGGILMLSLPVAVTCIARTIEYDRLRTEIMRKNASSIGNPRVDKLINRFYATPSRQWVCALALSTLEFGLSEAGSYAHVRQVQESRRKRLVPPTLMSRDWWLAHFTPVDLSV